MNSARRADAAFGAAVLTGVLFIALLGPLDRRLELERMNDFAGVWAGPHAALAGVSPYDAQRYPEARAASGVHHTDAPILGYMPWVVVALLPLGLLPLEVAAWIWMLASMALAAFAMRALLRAFVPGRVLVHGALGLALFVGQPGFHTIVLGQWSLLLF